MEAGPLHQRLVFQVKVIPEEQSRSGAIQEEWTTDFTVYGAFEPLGSDEFPAFNKRHAKSTARFRIRYRPGIDSAKHRIYFQSRVWDIYPPLNPDGRKIELHIEATEVL